MEKTNEKIYLVMRESNVDGKLFSMPLITSGRRPDWNKSEDLPMPINGFYSLRAMG